MNDGPFSPLVRAFAAIGRLVIGPFSMIGRVTLFAFTTLIRALTPPYYPARFFAQLMEIGWYSLPVVGLTAIFTGSALAQQIYTGGSRFDASSTVPPSSCSAWCASWGRCCVA